MDNENNVIDYGEWIIPNKWDDVTLFQYQQITKYYSDKEKKFDLRDVLEIFTNHTRDEINQLPVEFAEKIMNELSFVNEEPKYGDATNTIEIDGEKYSINVMQKLKTGEYLAVDTVLRADNYNYAAILAILCRKEGEIYDTKFENEMLDNRIELFKNISLMKVMPLVSFFLQRYMISTMPTLLSSEIKEGISHIRKDLEISAKNGDISKHSMKSAMKTLKKYEKIINGI